MPAPGRVTFACAPGWQPRRGAGGRAAVTGPEPVASVAERKTVSLPGRNACVGVAHRRTDSLAAIHGKTLTFAGEFAPSPSARGRRAGRPPPAGLRSDELNRDELSSVDVTPTRCSHRCTGGGD